jgi:thioredoxin 1
MASTDVIIVGLEIGVKESLSLHRRFIGLKIHERVPIGFIVQEVEGMADNKPVHVTDQDFEDVVLKRPGVAVVDFWAPWCGPCHTMAPALDAFAAANAEGIGVFKLDVDDNPKTAEKYAIRSIPTVIYFKDGKPVHTSVGALSESALQEKLAALLT